MLCGTREEVADRAGETQAGMHMPILQPVVQEEEHVDAVLAAAAMYAGEGR